MDKLKKPSFPDTKFSILACTEKDGFIYDIFLLFLNLYLPCAAPRPIDFLCPAQTVGADAEIISFLFLASLW